MDIEKITQQPVDFLVYTGEVTFDSATGEVVIPAGTYRIFEHEVSWDEERFIPQPNDVVWLTDQGLVLQRDNATMDFSLYQRYDRFGWVEGDTFKYIIHPEVG